MFLRAHISGVSPRYYYRGLSESEPQAVRGTLNTRSRSALWAQTVHILTGRCRHEVATNTGSLKYGVCPESAILSTNSVHDKIRLPLFLPWRSGGYTSRPPCVALHIRHSIGRVPSCPHYLCWLPHSSVLMQPYDNRDVSRPRPGS